MRGIHWRRHRIDIGGQRLGRASHRRPSTPAPNKGTGLGGDGHAALDVLGGRRESGRHALQAHLGELGGLRPEHAVERRDKNEEKGMSVDRRWTRGS